MKLKDGLTRLCEPNPALHAWQPRLFDLGRSSDAAALADSVVRGGVHQGFDSLLQQLQGLIETRCPAERLAADELLARARAHLGGVPEHAYGTWVYYPWSGRLVHVLGAAEFAELRTSRNRNKITAEEQGRLAALCVAVAGLSVGQATAVTLALEGVGGRFRLADFDHLELSNMNRLRAGVHELGTNKAVLTAQRIFEQNPYAEVEVFERGVTVDNLPGFLDGADLLFEECDDLQVKILLRQEARARRIPVLMETSDRGLIDVERFDREPERPLLHGLVGEVRAEDLKGLSTYEKVPIVLRMIGADTLSPRMAASLVDIETSLKTWPQLASGVALGGALNTDVARRLALGQLNASGRYYVDFERLVADDVDGRVPEPPAYVTPAGPPRSARRPPAALRTGELDTALVRSLVDYATAAPSGGNCQPWSFVFRAAVLYLLHDDSRSRSFLDFEHRAAHLALGCALENLVLAAGALGLRAHVDPFPEVDLPGCVAAVRFSPAAPDSPEVLHLIGERATNRRLSPRAPLGAEASRRLAGAAERAGVRLQLVEDAPLLAELGDILGRGDRVRFLSKVMHQELMGELRWSREHADATKDGIDVATLELTPTDVAGMRLVASPSLMDVLRDIGAGRGLEKATRKAVDASSAMGLVTCSGAGPRGYLDGGRAVQRLWLEATALGLAFQPMTALLYLFARAEGGGGDTFTESEHETLAELRRRFDEVFPPRAERTELMLFRVARAGAPSARALRRPVADVLSFG